MSSSRTWFGGRAVRFRWLQLLVLLTLSNTVRLSQPLAGWELGLRDAQASVVSDYEESNVWQRAKSSAGTSEREILIATERILSGSGDDRDMLRARAALVSLSRGGIQTPRLVLLLIRFRRELSLSPPRNASPLLEGLLAWDLAPLLRAEVHQELAYLHWGRQRLQSARIEVGLALETAWLQELRGSLFNQRGWIDLSLGDHRGALSDFALARTMRAASRVRVQAALGTAVASGFLGNPKGLDDAALEAYRVHAVRARASGASLFWDLPVHSPLEQAALVVLEWGRASSLQSADLERARSIRHDACATAFERALEDAEFQILRDLWNDACEPLLQENTAPLSLDSGASKP